MTPSNLREAHESANPESKYFTRENMKFFGDTMRNYGVRSVIIMSHTNSEGVYHYETMNKIAVHELYRRAPVKHGLDTSTYFHMGNFKVVHSIK